MIIPTLLVCTEEPVTHCIYLCLGRSALSPPPAPLLSLVDLNREAVWRQEMTVEL